MTAAELIAELQKLPPQTRIVNFATVDGYNDILGVARIEISVRRPRSTMHGYGGYVATETLPKRSKAKRESAALIGWLHGDHRSLETILKEENEALRRS